jgi:hypothetical protein
MTENRKKKKIDSQNIARHSLRNHKNAAKREAAQFIYDEYHKMSEQKRKDTHTKKGRKLVGTKVLKLVYYPDLITPHAGLLL